jgi:spore germination cell wall hydrolase CwlJ-like protein
MMMLKRLVIFLILVLLPIKVAAKTETALKCMAKNIYFEAKSESFAGQAAVALVVLNRVKHKAFPSTICEVIYEGPLYESWKTRQIPDLPQELRTYYPRRDRCQFSWYCDGKADKVKEESAYQEAHRIAWLVLNGHIFDFTEGAIFYHADYVQPKWAKDKQKLFQLDNHIFYRNK